MFHRTYYTTGTGFTFTLPNISGYDAIFLGANYLNSTELGVLSSYVGNGGNVYISAGTGANGSVAEAAAWNGFLSSYGIQLGNSYTGFSGNVTTLGDALFSGVSELYIGNPNGVISGAFCCTEEDVFAVWRSDDNGGVNPIPLPASLPLLAFGILGLSWAARRKQA